jgi:DNA-directed RNA polymerase subunit RPC12/RpoP/ribosomal protein L40E
MLVFACKTCGASLSAEQSQAGQLVRCPTCLTTLRVPSEEHLQPAMASAGGGSLAATEGATSEPSARPRRETLVPPPVRRTGAGGKRYGFNCAYCSSRLEATESMAAQEGQCPTCGNNITIPILDRYGRLIDPVTKQIIKQDPHPVHAYAAAGDRAPKIVRQNTGAQNILCPRCNAFSAITANNCKSCGMPFTMEGTTLEASGTSNGFCVASLVLGIIGLPAGCTLVIPGLGLILGMIGYNQVSKGGEGSGRGMAIAGMICSTIGLGLAFWLYVLR